MKLWRWFCRLGMGQHGRSGRRAVPGLKKNAQAPDDAVCSRLCGLSGCQCGGSMRGQYCVWSHYRIDSGRKEDRDETDKN